MTIDRWISEAAVRHPDKTAISFNRQDMTYGDFDRAVKARAEALVAGGIGRGDRIAWYGFNNPEVFILLFAAAKTGAILLPLNWRLADAEIAEILASAEPKILFHDESFAGKAGATNVPTVLAPGAEIPADRPSELHEVSENDALLLVYTSGSTGRPKGVMLPQKSLIANALMSVDAHAMQPHDRVLNVLPLFHVGGLNILPTPAFSIGATVELHEKFDPHATYEAMTRVDLAIMVPTVMQAIIAAGVQKSGQPLKLRAISIGSTDVPLDLIRQAHGKGIPAIQVYGATETCPFAIYQRVDQAMATEGSIGRASPHCAVRLVLPDGSDAPQDTPGEIWVKGDNIFTEYWRDPEETAKALDDGWFKTGDVAWLDGLGNYWFCDRIKHVIISGGENIYPTEIERPLRNHPNIKEVAAVGVDDPKWGQVPVVVAARAGTLTEQDVLAFLGDKLARYKQPKRVVFVEKLPRNAMGKVVVDDLRKLIS